MLTASFAYGEEACDQDADPTFSDVADTAEAITKDCSDKTLEHKAMCQCLADAKFNEIKVGWKTKKDFHQWEFDKSLREKLNHAVHDQISNFTKFSNLLKTKQHIGNLIDDSEPLCNIETIAKDIEAVQKISGSAECPTPKGFLPNRLKEIFGTTNPKEISEKLKFETTKVDENACISTQLYLDLRSNSGAAANGFKTFIGEGGRDIKSLVQIASPDEKEAYRDLLSYDVFFNLSYRDPDFHRTLSENMARIKKNGGRTFDIYNDQETLKDALKSLNRSCNQLMKNVKGFLCANDHPKFDAPIMRSHLDDYLNGKKGIDADEKTAIRDYLTDRYSCQERTATVYRRTVSQVIRGEDKVQINQSLEEKEFEDYIGNVVLLKTTTESFKKDDPKSDINTFNSMFCKGFEGKEISPDNLPVLMSNYLQSLKDQGKDITKILEDENLQKKLGLKIKTNPISFSLLDEDDIKAGKLPKINQFKWLETMAPELEKMGMSKEEVGQLYAIIEMQTNKQFSRMEELQNTLIATNPVYKTIPIKDIHSVAVNKDPEAARRINEITSKFQGPLPTAPNALTGYDAETLISARYEALQSDSTRNNDVTQSLFRGEVTVNQLKEDAQVYNQNLGTYSNRLVAPQKDLSQSGFVSGGAVTAPAQSPPTTPITEPVTSPRSEAPSTASVNSGGGNASALASPMSAGVTPSSYTASNSSSDNYSSSSSSSNGWESKKDSGYKPEEDSYLKDIQRRIDETTARLAGMDKEEELYKKEISRLEKNNSRASRSPASESMNSTAFNNSRNIDPSYEYPKNIPFSDGKGNFFYPPERSGELSSNEFHTPKEAELSSDAKENSKGASGSSGGGSGGSGASGASPSGSSGGSGAVSLPSVGSLDGIGSDIPSGNSKESEEEARKRLALATYEFPKYVPHALVEMVGSIDGVVLILGLEGKKFKTIQAAEKFEKGSAKADYIYNVRTYDFVPEGEFEDMKEDFINKESRENTFNKYFGFPRTKENMVVSKKYAMGTKEVLKEEYTHTQVLKIQNEIMGETELKQVILSVSEKLK